MRKAIGSSGYHPGLPSFIHPKTQLMSKKLKEIQKLNISVFCSSETPILASKIYPLKTIA